MATFVLVHGAWHGGWCWQRVTPGLRATGHDVYTPTLTGLGERVHLARPDVDLETHIRDVANVVEYEDLQDVQLVGHSYSGLVVTGVADRLPGRIGQLIYLDASVPTDGHSFFDDAGPAFQEAVEEAARAYGDGWRWPTPPAEILGSYTSMAGIGEAELRRFYAKATPHPVGTLRQPLRLAHQGPLPFGRTYIVCRAGHDTPSAGAEHARTSPDWAYRELDTGHWPMFSVPDRLARLLDNLAETCSPRSAIR